MNQVRIWESRRRAAWVGTLAVLLAVCAGTAHAQPRPVPEQSGKPVAAEAPGGPENDKPVQPVAPKFNQKPILPTNPVSEVGAKTNLLYELTTWFVVIMFSAGGIVALAVAARVYFRITRPTDFQQLALNDPWIQARLNQLDAGTPDNPDESASPPVVTDQ